MSRTTREGILRLSLAAGREGWRKTLAPLAPVALLALAALAPYALLLSRRAPTMRAVNASR